MRNASKPTAPTWITVITSVLVAGLIIVHALWPQIQIDAITIALLLLPFVVHYLPSIVEFEGFGVRLKRAEIDARIDAAAVIVESTKSRDFSKMATSTNPDLQERFQATLRSDNALSLIMDYIAQSTDRLTELAITNPGDIPQKIKSYLDMHLYLLLEDYDRVISHIIPGKDIWQTDIGKRTRDQQLTLAVDLGLLTVREQSEIEALYRLLNPSITALPLLTSDQAIRIVNLTRAALAIIFFKRSSIDPHMAEG